MAREIAYTTKYVAFIAPLLAFTLLSLGGGPTGCNGGGAASSRSVSYVVNDRREDLTRPQVHGTRGDG
jgi:hypothetical protein